MLTTMALMTFMAKTLSRMVRIRSRQLLQSSLRTKTLMLTTKKKTTLTLTTHRRTSMTF